MEIWQITEYGDKTRYGRPGPHRDYPGRLLAVEPCPSGFGEWQPSLGARSFRAKSLSQDDLFFLRADSIYGLTHYQSGAAIVIIVDDCGDGGTYIWQDAPDWVADLPGDED